MNERTSGLAPVSFSGIAGWAGDDHAAAFAAFHHSCARIVKVADARAKTVKGNRNPHPFTPVCRVALARGERLASDDARAFFERHFTPHRYGKETPPGLVTGYYEPELAGARSRSERFNVPVYRAPDDLVQLYPDSERAKRNHEMTAGRKTADGLVPYYDRREIDQGALAGRGLEIVYLENPVDAFYMHVQGSARIALEEGGHIRLGFAAKNGHSYSSIGKRLIERKAIPPGKMSMKAVRAWLEADPARARELMWENRSYIFFRELPERQAVLGPVGAQGVALTPERSLAVDTSLHALGSPVWVSAPELRTREGSGFGRLMIAQDAGSAIKGAERGDIFWGSGDAAGDIAGRTKHKARFTILLPKPGPPES